MTQLNETHDPTLTSWVADADASDFPIQNLPFGVFRREGSDEAFRCGVAIGDQILDLAALADLGTLSGLAATAADAGRDATLNRLMGLGAAAHSALRLALSRGLRAGAAEATTWRACLVPEEDAELALPARVGDFTDFYTSIHHATNIGRLFRPNNPLLPNYRWIPIGYHGRSSSVILSGAPVRRPVGQKRPPVNEDGSPARPGFSASARMDYELELGVYIGAGNALGEPVSLAQADDHVFGVSLLNDWSARDIQAWEYQPLGPFLAKNFATSVSPWIVTLEALAPFRTAWTRPEGEPEPLAYLDSERERAEGALDITLEVWLETTAMREAGTGPERLSVGSYKHAWWTLAQLVTHHTVNGCNLTPGDLLGTGTLSGPEAGSEGALIEITKGGKEPKTLSNGETRTFLDDGDVVILRGWCQAPGAQRIGLGEVHAMVTPARTLA